jgi:hypothetical protein
MKWLVLVLCAGALGGCKPDPAPPPARGDMPTLPANEIKRGQDACQAYVAKVCACAETVPAMKSACELARALPEAISVAVDVAGGSDVTRRDVAQTSQSVRSIVKQCIEETAKLPAAGCS